ncbi:MAG: right-handed parallel beta-helix repeat-containing protein, partial [Minisyncoccia bacterium]
MSGLDDATIIKKQYWSTENINSNALDGVKNSLMIGKNFNANLDSSTWKISNFTLKDLVIDGNSGNQILYDFSDIGTETNNTLISFPNSDFVTIQNVKIRTSPGPAVFAEGSTIFSISTSTFFDGCDTERYETDCLLLSDCENLTVTGSVFRNYPGALDFTTGKVIVVNGSVIRNCGSGIKIFGSVNTDVLNNVIIGPADEFIHVADLYDSDYDGVNISVIRNADSQTPVYSYQQFGTPKDLTNTILKFDVYPASVANGLETINFNNPITSGGNPLFEYYVPVDNLGNPINDITIGEIQYRISSANSNLIPNKTINSYTVYQISGIDYENVGSDIV